MVSIYKLIQTKRIYVQYVPNTEASSEQWLNDHLMKVYIEYLKCICSVCNRVEKFKKAITWDEYLFYLLSDKQGNWIKNFERREYWPMELWIRCVQYSFDRKEEYVSHNHGPVLTDIHFVHWKDKTSTLSGYSHCLLGLWPRPID